MDSVAFFSFWVVGMMVMLVGQVLGSAVFCVLKLSCTIKIELNKKQKDPQVIYQLLFDVFLSSLKCEINGTSQGIGVYIE